MSDDAGQRRAQLAGVEKEIDRLREQEQTLRDELVIGDELDNLARAEDATAAAVARRADLVAGLEARLARAENSVEELNDALAFSIQARKKAERLLELAEKRRADAENAQRDTLIGAEEVRRRNLKTIDEVTFAKQSRDEERDAHNRTRATLKDSEAAVAVASDQLTRLKRDLAASEAQNSALNVSYMEMRQNHAHMSSSIGAVGKERDHERALHSQTRLEAATEIAALTVRLNRTLAERDTALETIATLRSADAEVRRHAAQMNNETLAIRKERDAERQAHGDTHTRIHSLEAKLAVEAGQLRKITRELGDALAVIDTLKGEVLVLRQK